VLCLVPDQRPGAWVNWYINHDLAQKFSIRIEHLNAMISPVCHVDVVLGVDGDAVWSIKLARLVAGVAPRL
jgi:hypothetical protein